MAKEPAGPVKCSCTHGKTSHSDIGMTRCWAVRCPCRKWEPVVAAKKKGRK
jgi:hypothetical protein